MTEKEFELISNLKKQNVEVHPSCRYILDPHFIDIKYQNEIKDIVLISEMSAVQYKDYAICKICILNDILFKFGVKQEDLTFIKENRDKNFKKEISYFDISDRFNSYYYIFDKSFYFHKSLLLNVPKTLITKMNDETDKLHYMWKEYGRYFVTSYFSEKRKDIEDYIFDIMIKYLCEGYILRNGRGEIYFVEYSR